MQGLEKFKEYMSGFRSHYVVIGGLATVLTLEDRNLPARATKDVDRLAYVFDGSERFEVNETIKEQLRAFVSEVEKSPIDGKNMFRGQGIPAMGMKEFSALIRGMFGVE